MTDKFRGAEQAFQSLSEYNPGTVTPDLFAAAIVWEGSNLYDEYVKENGKPKSEDEVSTLRYNNFLGVAQREIMAKQLYWLGSESAAERAVELYEAAIADQ